MDVDAIEYQRNEVISEGDQISRVDSSNLEPHIEQRTSHSKRTLGLDKEMEGELTSILLDTGGGITSISEGSAADLQEKLLGPRLVRPSVGRARVRTVFDQEDIITTQTVPLMPTI